MVIIKQKPVTAEQRRVQFIVIKEVIRNNVREARWSREVRARARNVCVDCGGVGNEAHHVKPLRELVVEYNITTPEQALACDALFDVDNGVCVCKECHKKRHPENY